MIMLCICGSAPLIAQQTTGTIQGIVADPSGASIPGAKLMLWNESTGVKRNTVSQPSGNYIFNALDPGTYSLTVKSPGFKTVLVRGINVQVALTTTANVKMQIGVTSQVVKVTGAAPLIDTTDAQVTTVIPKDYIQQLGSASRSALAYADFAPGVNITLQAAAGAAANLCITCGSRATINGSFSARSTYYLDGIQNFGAYRNYALQFPSPDAIQEVIVNASNTSAQYGAQMGGAINVITKSGTNHFHGDAFYFFSPEVLSANDAGRKFYKLPKVPNNMKELGGTLGGPIIKNKTFFFVSYQRYSNSSSVTQSGVRPGTPAMMQGDFSGLLHPTSASGLDPVQLYDPNYPGQSHPIPDDDLKTYVSPATGKTLLNPVGLNLAKYMPTVSNYGDQFIWQYTEPQVNDEIFAKVDQDFGNAQLLSVSYFHVWGLSTLPGMGDNYNNVPKYGPELDESNQTDLAVRDSWMLSSKLLVQSFFSLAFSDANRTNAQIGNDLSTLGAVNVPARAIGARKYLPNLYFNGMTAGEGWLSQFNQHNYQFGSTVTWLHDKHQVKIGFGIQKMRVYQDNDQDNGGIHFNGAFATGIFGHGNPSDTGPALADMLMGYSEGFSETGILLENDSNWADYFFAQDQWNVTPRITLTPGLRYELYFPPTEANNKLTGFIPGHQSVQYPSAYIGLAFPGDPGVPKGLYNTDYTDVAPRMGVAWNVTGDGRTSLRGGVGWYYSANPLQDTMNNSESDPWYPSAGCSYTIISNPWLDCHLPSYAAPPTPLSVSPQSLKTLNWGNTFGPISAVGYARDFKNAYSIQYNATFQHQFPHNITVSTGYVGNHGFRIPVNVPINYAVYSETANLQPANIISRQPYSTGAYAGNDGAGLYNNALVLETAKGEYYYSGWQTVVDMRPVNSLQLHASYEYARGETNDITNDITNGGVNQVVNPTAPFASWGPYLPRDVFKGFFLWRLPIQMKNRWLNNFAGGWHLTGDVNASSGSPANISLGYDWEYDGLGQTNPSLNGPIQYSWKRSKQNFIQYLNIGNTSGQPGLDSKGNPVAQRGPWTLPGGGTNHAVYGNAPLNSVFLPGTWTADLSLLKDFHFTRAQYFELRFEGYNVFNHEAYGCLNTTYTSPDFGQLQCNYGARTVQLGMKYYF